MLLTLVRECAVTGPAEVGMARVITERHAAWSPGWVARIGWDERGTVCRHFQEPVAKNLSRAGNGTQEFAVPPGLYEAASVWRSYTEHRVWFEVTVEGEIVVLGSQEAVEARYCALTGEKPWELRAQARQAAREAYVQAAQARAEVVGSTEWSADLPPLQGSEKQVAWGTDIRIKVLAEIETWHAEASRYAPAEVAVAVAELRAWLVTSGARGAADRNAPTSAAWWIDRRGDALLSCRDVVPSLQAARDAAVQARRVQRAHGVGSAPPQAGLC